jgi:hypothetical protein
MKKLFIMYCEDDRGEYELWFNDNDVLIGGYFCNDAQWRGEYFDGMMEDLGIDVHYSKYSSQVAKKSAKKLWGG